MRSDFSLLNRRGGARPASSAPPLPLEIETFVRRFEAPARREVRRLVRSSPRMAELALVFPGALHALAIRRGPPCLRQAAAGLVLEGAPLRSVARALDLPLWLRRLPPEAFRGELGVVPGGEAFTRRIANRLPISARQSAFWLSAISFAAKACHEDFALWLAEQPVFADESDPGKLFAVLAAYAWFSGAALTRAHGLIVVPWRSEIAFDTALCAAKSWLNRMRLVLQLGEGAITDPWLAPGAAAGYAFVPLTEQRALLDEAHAMQNCADQYAERLSRDRCRLFSVRRAGIRVATLEIGPHARETGVLAITQLKSRHNMPATVEVWQAAHAWLATQAGLKRLPPMSAPDRPFEDRVWAGLTQPYRQRRAGAPWLPAMASPATFGELDSQLADLARRGGVTSWLFT